MEALDIDVEGTGGWRQSEGEERREQRVGDTSPLPLPMLPAHLALSKGEAGGTPARAATSPLSVGGARRAHQG